MDVYCAKWVSNEMKVCSQPIHSIGNCSSVGMGVRDWGAGEAADCCQTDLLSKMRLGSGHFYQRGVWGSVDFCTSRSTFFSVPLAKFKLIGADYILL